MGVNQLLKLLGLGSKVEILQSVVVSSPWLNVLFWGFTVSMSPLGRIIGKAECPTIFFAICLIFDHFISVILQLYIFLGHPVFRAIWQWKIPSKK